MQVLLDPFFIAIYQFLIGLPVAALGMRIEESGHERKNDWISGIGTAVEGVAIALTFPILYPILIVTVFLAEIWIDAIRAVLSLIG
jgi:hypothetical protein